MNIRSSVDDVVPPNIAALRHADAAQVPGGGGAVDDQHVLDGVPTGDGGVGVVLDGHRNPTAELAIRRHQELGLGIFHAETERLGGEAAEHQRVDRPNAGHSQGDDDGLGNHRKVDHHAVALGDTQRKQCVGRFGHFALQFGVGDSAAVTGLALEIQGHLVTPPGQHMPVHAVVRYVQFAAVEPGDLRASARLDVGRFPRVRGMPGRSPVQSAGLFLPKADS
ncbi:hypothetical protein J2Y66_001029 [Paenarthrobacter nitroguajacolicus]|nr:hypothetical protein [Paenarthrobacter nitroguajacolicus]